MSIPKIPTFLKPLLDITADGREHSVRESCDKFAVTFEFSKIDLAECFPSGPNKLYNTVAFAKKYLLRAKLLEETRRGYFKITDRGRDLLKEEHTFISVDILDRYREFTEWHYKK